MRWLLSTWGSLGDLHPFLSLGKGLIARGHQVALVGHPEWEIECNQAGLEFISTGEPPRKPLIRDNPNLLSPKAGGLVSLKSLVEKEIAPSFEPTTEALLKHIPRFDVMIAHHLSFAAPMAAELTKIPYATVTLAPSVIPSAYGLPGSNFKRVERGRWARIQHRLIWSVGRRLSRIMIDPKVNRLRQQFGAQAVKDAMFADHSPILNLQLYSQHFATRPPDFTPEKQYGGFCYYDPAEGTPLPAEVERFLNEGADPVLCTLGTAAVKAAGEFFLSTTAALQKLKMRGILLIGDESNRPANLPSSIIAVPSIPYSLIMPRVRLVIHQCGIGTLSHTLRAGKPSIACPFAFDQPNNARRLEALNVAEVLLPRQRKPKHFEKAITKLLTGPAEKVANRLGEVIRAEDGVRLSCEVLEKTFTKSHASAVEANGIART